MTKASKYATLDAVILQAVQAAPRHGLSPSYVRTNPRIRAFAMDANEKDWYAIIGRRMQYLHGAGKITNNRVSGDGCRWWAAP